MAHDHWPPDVDGLVALLELSQDLTASGSLDAHLRRIEASALRMLGCERFTVFTREASVGELRSQVATGAADICLPVDRGIAAATLREGRLINVHDVSVDPRFFDGIDRQTGYRTRSLMSLPLRDIGNQPTGVLELLNKHEGAFTRTDEELALGLGSLTAITLQRQTLVDAYREKRRLDHDLELARCLQRSLLPTHAPRPNGYEFAGWSQAADATGGDFYDYVELSDGRLGFIVADVAGHGLAASLLASETRALIRSAASARLSFIDIVSSVNQLLYEDLNHERFVVLFVAALDAARAQLEFVAAGCVAFVYRCGQVETLDSTMPPLAILPEVPAGAARSLTLGPGDAIVLATDGFYEWENPFGEQYGMGRLRENVRANAQRPPADVIRALHRDVLTHTAGVKPSDDLTAMVITRVGSS